jgi:hypothetical protein
MTIDACDLKKVLASKFIGKGQFQAELHLKKNCV